jgi:catechol 2,3-dioxygenase-like lactoylglutathione lyase family enzyme
MVLGGFIMARSMYHTGFVVEDMDRAVKFYTEGIGLEIDADMDLSGYGLEQVVGYDNAQIRAVMLKTHDGQILELLQYIEPKGQHRQESQQHPRNLIGAAHLGFMVDDAEESFRKCMELGGQKLNSVVEVLEGLKAAYLQDPDGNWIELVEDSVHKANPFTIIQNRTRP